jgi:hypothetical protein
MKTLVNREVKNYPNAVISEDLSNWYVDLKQGLNEGEYTKIEWTLDEAIEDQINFELE